MEKLKQKVFDFIISDGTDSTRGDNFDKFITILIVLNVFAVVAESYADFEKQYHYVLLYFEIFSVFVFSIEYILRIWTATILYPDLKPYRARIKFAFSFLAIIDLLAVLPFYLPLLITVDLRFVRALRLVRLLRVLKLSRHNESLKMMGRVLKKSKSELGITVFVVLILLIVASSMMFFLEHDAQPDAFSDIGQGFWWAVATLTTVGYGDIYPVTGWGKLVSGLIALLGIGLVALPTGIIGSSFMDEIQLKRKKVQSKKNTCKFDHTIMTTRFCPHCGDRL